MSYEVLALPNNQFSMFNIQCSAIKPQLSPFEGGRGMKLPGFAFVIPNF